MLDGIRDPIGSCNLFTYVRSPLDCLCGFHTRLGLGFFILSLLKVYSVVLFSVADNGRLAVREAIALNMHCYACYVHVYNMYITCMQDGCIGERTGVCYGVEDRPRV